MSCNVGIFFRTINGLTSSNATVLGLSAVLPQLRKVPENCSWWGLTTVPSVYGMRGMDSSSEHWRATAKPFFA